ncbi:nitroreductase family protein [Runella sp. MFBS21]|uniref:nitroreductase family protein n=1 Tax=Runella sp. MFBS21 TaxID=3034018 RepID=UPI0023F99960|nr:nitroreductase family protein [Runella sp. MFBS21]MDF7821077.1 nitroreductase family protein [Runella sp. MFBS21]
MNTHEILQWRYATKRYNGQLIPKEKLDYILEAARLAPSSSGLQAYKIFVISEKTLLDKIKVIAMNQPQINECSHLLVFASWDKYSEERLSETFRKVEIGRGMTTNQLEDYKKLLLDLYTPLGETWQANHLARQTYISASMAMVAAAEVGIDSTPMEGFNNAELDQLLELNTYGLKSQILLPLGYRDTVTDWNLPMPKYRRPLEELVVEIN